MQTHGLDRLLKLVDTAYYQQNGKKAVCEVLGQKKDKYAIVTLLVNGRNVLVNKGTVQDVLAAYNLPVQGWTTKPQLSEGTSQKPEEDHERDQRAD